MVRCPHRPNCHPRESGDPAGARPRANDSLGAQTSKSTPSASRQVRAHGGAGSKNVFHARTRVRWVPAFAGMTVVGLISLALAACTVGPDFLKPSPETPETWTKTATAAKGKSVAVPAEPDNDAWWESFHDKELSSLVARARGANLDLKEAALRIAEARWQERITRAGEYPTLGGNASYASTQFSTTTAQGAVFGDLGSIKGPPGLQFPSFPNPYDQYQLGFDASWEPDLFGGLKRSEEANSAQTEAAEEASHDALVSLEGEIGRVYIDLRGAQEKLAITEDTLAADRETLTLLRQRLAAKLGNELDVRNEAAQVATTQSEVPVFDGQIDGDINQLSYLLAREPQALRSELIAKHAVPPVPPQVPIGLPSDLARRRPDIREAEANLHAATANVGVAVANLYPTVTFTAGIGTQAERFPNLADWASRFFQAGPTINVPIFEGGRLKATVRLDETAQKLAAVDYAKTVLSAVHDVENALVAYDTEQRRRAALVESVKENTDALALARLRYRDGMTTFLDVLTAQRTLLAARLTLADSTASVSTDLVALYKALGGGWEEI